MKQRPTEKDKLLQLKTAIRNQLREIESESLILKGQLKSVNKDLEDLANKQKELF